MRKQTLSSILFWAVAALGAALLVAFLLALVGVVPVDPPPQQTSTEETALTEPEPPATTRPVARTQPPRRVSSAPTTTPPPTPPRRTTTLVVITATRGASWFSARLGSENGRVLDERVLAQGESARFEGERIWLSVGAAGNVDITVDGRRRPIAPGTVSLVLTGSAAGSSTS